MTNNISPVLNNSFTSNGREKNEENRICNALGCHQPANIEIPLKIGKKAISIFVCKSCEHKFTDRWKDLIRICAIISYLNSSWANAEAILEDELVNTIVLVTSGLVIYFEI